MRWVKKGLIYTAGNDFPWMKDRAIAPVCQLRPDGILRIYFSSRDHQGRSTPIFLETDPAKPEDVVRVVGTPILPFGEIGSFDDNGILSSSIVEAEGKSYLYYVGWNPRVTVPYHLSIGLAVSNDGEHFTKFSDGPILDRSREEPFFNTAPFVLKGADKWRMWYVSATGWKLIDGNPEPLYNVKYATSTDGVEWIRTGAVAIQNDEFAEAVGKPFVFTEDGTFKMIYSYRNSINYRTDPRTSYRLGYAESNDGEDWTRKDADLGLVFSESGWDSVMMEYASSYLHEGKRYVVYNGNGFGESGFGYAVREED
jgi:hypothetical protein